MSVRDLQDESEEEEAERKQAKRERRGRKHWVGRAWLQSGERCCYAADEQGRRDTGCGASAR